MRAGPREAGLLPEPRKLPLPHISSLPHPEGSCPSLPGPSLNSPTGISEPSLHTTEWLRRLSPPQSSLGAVTMSYSSLRSWYLVYGDSSINVWGRLGGSEGGQVGYIERERQRRRNGRGGREAGEQRKEQEGGQG